MSILELQDEMSGLGICSPLNPESGIDQRGFGILHRLLVSTNVYLGAGQELNVLGASTKLRHTYLRLWPERSAVNRCQKIYWRLACDVEDRPFKFVSLLHELLNLPFQKHDRIIDKRLIVGSVGNRSLWRCRFKRCPGIQVEL